MRCLAVSPQVSAAVLCVLLLCARAGAARAAGVVGTGSADSCTNAALDAALKGGGLVTFNCGGPATIDITIDTADGERITADTIIDGGGVITISGGNVRRLFSVYDADVTLRNLTIANAPGAIRASNSSLTITNSTLTDNVGGTFGAVIDLDRGSLTVANCTFSGNSGHYAGVIDSTGAPNISVTNSTFTGNRGSLGAAMFVRAGRVAITNSTFTHNISDGIGAFVGTITYVDGVTMVLRNTIVAENMGGPNCNSSTASIDGGHNLDDGLSCGFSAANGSLSDADPHLDPAGLQDNGGSTQTVALCTAVDEPEGCTAASPAIDTGDPSACADAPVNDRDQRGFVRPGATHTNCSIGAYEADAIESVCIGDCDNNGVVTVNELLRGVNIVLGNQAVTVCPAFMNSQGIVDIAQLVTGVNNTLKGCDGD